MRKIILDTESTGLDPVQGHRLVEIGCIELNNHVPTGRVYHQYINPERDMPIEAFKVHGLSTEFLKDHPPFREVYSAFLAFIEDSPLIIHNAKFDMRFLNAELKWHNQPEIDFQRALCTMEMARKKYPGSPASLDALCRRFGIDNTKRVQHGALLDAELLANVYLELIGGRQAGLGLMVNPATAHEEQSDEPSVLFTRPPRPHQVPEEEQILHNQLLSRLKNPLWFDLKQIKRSID